MLKKRLIAIVLTALIATAALCADKLLPFFEFNFDEYLDTYHQLIVNDVYYDTEETPYYDSLEVALSMFSKGLDREALKEEVRSRDIASLKSFIRESIDNGEMLSEEEIYDILFNPDNMYSAYVTPTTDSAMSYFGHSFLIFYIPEAPMLSPCVNFYAYYEHLGALGTVFEGLAGTLISYYDLKPFYFSFLDYMATRDRAIRMYEFELPEVEKQKVHDVIRSLTEESWDNYNFLFNNCSHGFLNVINHIDEDIGLDMDRAVSPAMGMRMFNEAGVTDKPAFEFPAWNDVITGKSPKEFKDYYKSISTGTPGYQSEEPFENFPIRREVIGPAVVSSRFSSLTLDYEFTQNSEHRMGIWFKPVFNDFIEQNYVDHEIMNLHALNGSISARVDGNNRFIFEGFEAELFSFDSIFPFTTLKKRASFGADLSVGMRDFRFLAETEGYIGMSLGRSDIFWFFGLDNIASTAPLEYTLNFRSMLGGKFGPVSLLNTTDVVLFSTLHDYFHVENELEARIRIVDSLTIKASYNLSTAGGITGKVRHGGGVGLVYNFNIF